MGRDGDDGVCSKRQARKQYKAMESAPNIFARSLDNPSPNQAKSAARHNKKLPVVLGKQREVFEKYLEVFRKHLEVFGKLPNLFFHYRTKFV